MVDERVARAVQTGFRAASDQVEDRAQKTRPPFVIGIEEGDEGGPAFVNAAVSCAGNAGSLLSNESNSTILEARNASGTFIRRPVIYDHDLEVFKILSEDGLEGASDVRTLVEQGNDDAEEGSVSRIRLSIHHGVTMHS